MVARESKMREEWEIRDDARTLARAEEIRQDKGRYKDACNMAQKIADEEISRMSGLMKVAGKHVPQPNKAESTQFRKRDYVNPATVGRLF